VTKDVTKIVGDQYQSVIKSLTDQIGILKAQLASQATTLGTIKNSNIVTGKKPVPVQVINPPATPPLPPPVNISWQQAATQPLNGKATVLVTLRVDNPLAIPAFLATCDRPCETQEATVVGASQESNLNVNNQPTLTGFVFNQPRPLTPGIDVTWTIVSEDDKPVTIIKVRIVQPSELPESMR